jgi:hypothetical protein
LKIAPLSHRNASERDQENWSPVFRPIPLYMFEIDHVYQLELIQLKLINVI